MLLVIDVGNTNIKLGVYATGGALLASWRLATERAHTSDEYGTIVRQLFAINKLDYEAVNAMMIASVVPPLDAVLHRMGEVYFNCAPQFADYTSNTGLEIHYNPPHSLGADRLVNAAAAAHKYGAPCIVVDFGTATKFEVVNERRQYLGGVIAPGLGIAADALAARAARLPPIDIKRPATVIGASTVAAMQSGVYYGYLSLVDGILQRMCAELNAEHARIVATGGLARLIAPDSKLIEIVDDALTLGGLRMIYEKAI